MQSVSVYDKYYKVYCDKEDVEQELMMADIPSIGSVVKQDHVQTNKYYITKKWRFWICDLETVPRRTD